MTDVERQILLNQIAMIEALLALTPASSAGPGSTVELLMKRYQETSKIVRENPKQRG